MPELMVNWTEQKTKNLGNKEKDDKCKFIIGCELYNSLNSTRTTREKALTEDVRVNSGNRKFRRMQKTAVKLATGKKVTKVPALL